jgi:hypothetical protein
MSERPDLIAHLNDGPSADLDDAVFDLCALWRDALTNGRHVALRARWPELATALDAVIDNG